MIAFVFFFSILLWVFIKPHNLKSRNRYIFWVSLMYFLIIGLRNEVIYGDTYGYVHYFKLIHQLSLSEVLDLWNKDRFFWIITYYISRLTGGNYTIWLSLISLLIIYPLTKLIQKYSVQPMYSFVLFVYLGLMLFCMAGLRQTVSIAFILIGALALLDNTRTTQSKIIYYSVCVFLAYLFHGSSFVAILAILFINRPLNQSTILIYLVVLAVCFMSGRYLMSNVIGYMGQFDERYLGYGESMHGATLAYFIQQLILIAPSVIFLRRRFYEQPIALLLHFSIIGLICVSLSPIIAEMFRLSYFFSWSNILLFTYAIVEIRKYNKYLPFVFFTIFILLIVFVFKLNDYYFFFDNASHLSTRIDTSQYLL